MYRCINYGFSARNAVFMYRMIEYVKVRNPHIRFFRNTSYTLRRKIGNAINTAEIYLSFLIFIESSVRKFIALQSISRVVIDKTVILDIILADTHIGTEPYIMPGIFTKTANNIIGESVCRCKSFQFFRLFVETVKSVCRARPNITGIILLNGISHAA